MRKAVIAAYEKFCLEQQLGGHYDPDPAVAELKFSSSKSLDTSGSEQLYCEFSHKLSFRLDFLVVDRVHAVHQYGWAFTKLSVSRDRIASAANTDVGTVNKVVAEF